MNYRHMDRSMRLLGLKSIAAFLLAGMGPVALAQADAYPAKPIRIIVPFPAGEIGRAHV